MNGKKRFEPDGVTKTFETELGRKKWATMTPAQHGKALNRIGAEPDYTWPELDGERDESPIFTHNTVDC